MYKLLPPEPNVIFHSPSECSRFETIELNTVLVMPFNFIIILSTLNAEEFCYKFPLTLIYFKFLLWFKCILSWFKYGKVMSSLVFLLSGQMWPLPHEWFCFVVFRILVFMAQLAVFREQQICNFVCVESECCDEWLEVGLGGVSH